MTSEAHQKIMDINEFKIVTKKLMDECKRMVGELKKARAQHESVKGVVKMLKE